MSHRDTCHADKKRHIAIVGTGSAAFAAAIKATAEGARVTLIEAADVIGGTCVNSGCVPSKILIRGAHIAYLQSHHKVDGIALNTPIINRQSMLAQQQSWVKKLRATKYENLLERNPDISLLRGIACFKDSHTLLVHQSDGQEKIIKADRILLAVGARPAIADIAGLSDTPYWTSKEALVADHIPQRLMILGASVVALELAQAFHHLGSKVTLLARSTLLSKQDPQLGSALTKIFNDEGIHILLHSGTESIRHDGHQFTIITHDHEKYHSDQLIIATGREANTSALQVENAGIQVNERGNILVDKHMRTNVPHIYAAGDCTNQPQFVYVAAAAGSRAAINMMGGEKALNLSVVPAVVFTNPQIATVGLSEQQAKEQGLNVESRKLNLDNIPRAIANMDTRGFIKLVAEKESGRIVGCQILAAEAGEIIQTITLAIHHKMTIEELADQLFPYLTMVEGLKLTAQTFKQDIHQLSCCAG